MRRVLAATFVFTVSFSQSIQASNLVQYAQCLEDAKKEHVLAIAECTDHYAAASWSKFPFGKVASFAALKLMFCLNGAMDSFLKAEEACHQFVLGGPGGGGGGGGGGDGPIASTNRSIEVLMQKLKANASKEDYAEIEAVYQEQLKAERARKATAPTVPRGEPPAERRNR